MNSPSFSNQNFSNNYYKITNTSYTQPEDSIALSNDTTEKNLLMLNEALQFLFDRAARLNIDLQNKGNQYVKNRFEKHRKEVNLAVIRRQRAELESKIKSARKKIHLDKENRKLGYQEWEKHCKAELKKYPFRQYLAQFSHSGNYLDVEYDGKKPLTESEGKIFSFILFPIVFVISISAAFQISNSILKYLAIGAIIMGTASLALQHYLNKNNSQFDIIDDIEFKINSTNFFIKKPNDTDFVSYQLKDVVQVEKHYVIVRNSSRSNSASSKNNDTDYLYLQKRYLALIEFFCKKPFIDAHLYHPKNLSESERELKILEVQLAELGGSNV